jgi:hypothetical protein
MGFFDAIGKAMADSMSNDENLGKKQNPGFRVIIPPFLFLPFPLSLTSCFDQW